MGKYFEAIEPYTFFHPKLLHIFRPPNIIKPGIHYDNWREIKAKGLVLDLSAIAHLEMLRALNIKKDAVKRTIASSEHIKSGERKRKERIEELIEARRLSIGVLFPKEELPQDIKANISLLGLVGLGMLSVIYPDKIGEGMLRIFIISLLIKKDSFSALVREKFSGYFNGYKDIDELSREIYMSKLPPKHFKQVYHFLNL